jgi:hypothetical protein
MRAVSTVARKTKFLKNPTPGHDTLACAFKSTQSFIRKTVLGQTESLCITDDTYSEVLTS